MSTWIINNAKTPVWLSLTVKDIKKLNKNMLHFKFVGFSEKKILIS